MLCNTNEVFYFNLSPEPQKEVYATTQFWTIQFPMNDCMLRA